MRKLIAVWLITPRNEVLLKIKKINSREFALPFEAWQKRGESDLGTIKRILNEIEKFAPPKKFHLRFKRIKESEMETKFGKIKRVQYLCLLPFQPLIENSEILILKKENLKEYRNKILKEDNLTILIILGIQNTLTDF